MRFFIADISFRPPKNFDAAPSGVHTMKLSNSTVRAPACRTRSGVYSDAKLERLVRTMTNCEARHQVEKVERHTADLNNCAKVKLTVNTRQVRYNYSYSISCPSSLRRTFRP